VIAPTRIAAASRIAYHVIEEGFEAEVDVRPPSARVLVPRAGRCDMFGYDRDRETSPLSP
jgi:hypothetical protein